jgi:hypothetical protein
MMGRAATQYESAHASFVHHQANAILHEGKAVVAPAKQSARYTARTPDMKIIQGSNFLLQAEQNMFTNAELGLQRGWFMQRQTVRGEYLSEYGAECKSLLARLESALRAINREHAQRMQIEEAIFEKNNRDAASSRNEEFAPRKDSLIKSPPRASMGT